MGVMTRLGKRERLQEFIRRLEIAESCASAEHAYNLLKETLTEVENELTEIPNNPNAWNTDGRMYPPQMDSERKSVKPDTRRFRNRSHYTDIGTNGAIRISTVNSKLILLDKPGSDGKRVTDL